MTPRTKRFAVPIPKKMRALARDARGYPVPFNVLRDTDGQPHFAINDSRRRLRCLRENRCAICGSRLDRILWFVGGPGSAFHPNGTYNDTAMHYECMAYALQVCPYLAMPNYSRRVDMGTLDPAKLPPEVPAMFIDLTQDPARPPVFVAVASTGQSIGKAPTHYVTPVRPYVAVEYWLDGIRLTAEAAASLIQK